MKVTVIGTVYNQAPFLKQMIESVLAQKTDFDFEFIISNDASTDNSAEIIRQFSRLDSRIVFIDNQENIGFIKNYAMCFELAKGRYIADIGGDDFWIDSNKLQMQVDFLESNPEYGMVHTQFDELFTYRKFLQKRYKKNVLKPSSQLQGEVFYDIATYCPINAITVCFRKSIIEESELIEKFKLEEYKIEDLPMWLYISKHHLVGYIDQSTICYRRNLNSLSHFKNIDDYKKYMNDIRAISLSFLNKEQLEIQHLKDDFIQADCISNTYYYFKKGDYKNFSKYFKMLNNKPLDRIVMFWVLKLGLSFLFNSRQ